MNADIIQARTPAEVFLAEVFRTSKSALPGNNDVAQLREDSFRAFNLSGLPHRRIEPWHYTDLRSLMSEGLPLAAAPLPKARDVLRQQLSAAGVPEQRLVLADGFFVAELSSDL